MRLFSATPYEAWTLHLCLNVCKRNGICPESDEAEEFADDLAALAKTMGIATFEIVPSGSIALIREGLTESDRNFFRACGIASDFEDRVLRLPVFINSETGERYVQRNGHMTKPKTIRGFEGYEELK